jgi:DNA-binding transcriptional LysR family regulator
MASEYDNRITFQKLEIFCLVVELGGVSRAADRLMVAQPVVSTHLRSLQARLGTRLLYRDGNQMKLTPAGERVHDWARETLSRTRALMRELDGLSDGDRGSVVLAASMTLGSYVLPSVLSAFRARRPGASISLSVMGSEDAIAAVETGAADFAIVVANTLPSSPALRAEPLSQDSVVLVAAPDFDPDITSLPVQTLETAPLVSAPSSHIQRALLDDLMARHGVQPRNVVIELGHPEAMKQATRDGLGLWLAFSSAVRHELAEGLLRRIEIVDAEFVVPIVAVTRADKRLSPLQQELLDVIGDEFSATDGEVAPETVATAR